MATSIPNTHYYKEQNPFYEETFLDTRAYNLLVDPSTPIPSFVQEKITIAISIILFIGAKTIDRLNPGLGAIIRFAAILLIAKPVLNIYHFIVGNQSTQRYSSNEFKGRFDNSRYY